MASLFALQNFATQLDAPTKSLHITWQNPARMKHYRLASVAEEGEQILTWALHHLEISTLVWRNDFPLTLALSSAEQQNLAEAEFAALLMRWHKIIFSLYCLPQTIIFDLGPGAQGLGAEWACGADLRVAQTTAQISFPHLAQGRLPFGGISFLHTVVAPSYVKAWYLIGITPTRTELQQAGFIQHFYQRRNLAPLLKRIHQQSPLARIQAKRAFLEAQAPLLAQARQEVKLAQAALASGDWQQTSGHFTPALDLGPKIRQARPNLNQ